MSFRVCLQILEKALFFVVGVSNEVASCLAASLGFVLENLPVHYLGLPLLSSRLHLNDCVPLIQRITSQIRSELLKFYLLLVNCILFFLCFAVFRLIRLVCLFYLRVCCLVLCPKTRR